MNKVIAGLTLGAISSLSLNATFACCSLAPAHFGSTKGLAAEVKKDGKVVHLLGYQNTVKNKAVANKPSGNAMFLPIPAKAGSMDEKNMLDTSSYSNCLDDMENAILGPVAASAPIKAPGRGIEAHKVVVFEHDIYTVVLASNAEDIPAALAKVPSEKRPSLNPAIFKAYSKWYPKWTFALCCFNTQQEAKAKPMLWWYEPMKSDTLFFPALDAHDGKPPDLDAKVAVDHSLIVSSYKLGKDKGHLVHYSDDKTAGKESSLRKLLPDYVIGNSYNDQLPNGDFVFKVDDVRAGKYDAKRELPPGSAHHTAMK